MFNPWLATKVEVPVKIAIDHVAILKLMEDIKKCNDFKTLAELRPKLSKEILEHLAEEEERTPKAL